MIQEFRRPLKSMLRLKEKINSIRIKKYYKLFKQTKTKNILYS